jgi:phage terminase large subunit-like protein
MSSRSAVKTRVGAQRPTHLVTPEGDFDFSDGDDAIVLCEQLGLTLLDWQRWLVRWILAVDRLTGVPACSQVILIVPRQNGKGAVLEAVELYWLLVAGVPVVIHTAHEADTAAGHQARLDALTDDAPITIPALHSYKANGKERILNLDEKLLLQFRTRTKATKRGSSPQRVVLDECQELQEAHLSALVPAMAAQSMNPDKMPQLIYAGSAPLEHSFYLHDLLARVMEKQPPKTLLAMWGCDASVDPDDVDNWYLVNPSLGLLISEDFVRFTEHLVMGRDGFMAERLGVPQGGPGALRTVIPFEVWAAAVDPDSEIVSNHQWSLTVHDQREWAAIGIAGRRTDGRFHVGPLEHRPGTGWVLQRVVEAWSKRRVPIRIHKTGPEAAFIAPLRERGVEVVEVSSAEVAQATGQLIDAAMNDQLRHLGQPSLDKALAGAVLRQSTDGASQWSQRQSQVEITPLVAVTVALGGVPASSSSGLFLAVT